MSESVLVWVLWWWDVFVEPVEALDFGSELFGGGDDICVIGRGVGGGEGSADSVDDGASRIRRVFSDEVEFGERCVDGGVGEVSDLADGIVGAEAVCMSGVTREDGCIGWCDAEGALFKECVRGRCRRVCVGSFPFRSFLGRFWRWWWE